MRTKKAADIKGVFGPEPAHLSVERICIDGYELTLNRENGSMAYCFVGIYQHSDANEPFASRTPEVVIQGYINTAALGEGKTLFIYDGTFEEICEKRDSYHNTAYDIDFLISVDPI